MNYFYELSDFCVLKKPKFWLNSPHSLVLAWGLVSIFEMLLPVPSMSDRVSRFSFNHVDFCCLPRWCLNFLVSNQFLSISQAHCRGEWGDSRSTHILSLYRYFRSNYITPMGPLMPGSFRSPPGMQPRCLPLCFLPSGRFSLCLSGKS